MSSKDAVFQQVKYFRNKDTAKSLLGKQSQTVVVSDQCPSYHWIEPERHQFFLAHLQQMADYSGKGLTNWLERSTKVPASRYAGRCRYILKYEIDLWVFLNHPETPLTNNEAERCLRGRVIMRKICYGTSSDRGEKFRSRLLSVV